MASELIEPSTAVAAEKSASTLGRDERIPVASSPVGSESNDDSAARTNESMALLFALILGVAAIAAGAFVYYNRRRSWTTQRIAIGGSVAFAAAVGAFVLYLWADMKQVAQRDSSTQPEFAASQIGGNRPSSGVLARSAPLAGTYVCGEAKPGETHTTHTVMTRKYYSDGVYVDMLQTWSNSIPTATAIRIGVFEWTNDSRLILRQLAASPNIEAREPIVRTDVLVEQQQIANVTEQCRPSDELSTTMDELRKALKPLLPLDKQ